MNLKNIIRVTARAFALTLPIFLAMPTSADSLGTWLQSTPTRDLMVCPTKEYPLNLSGQAQILAVINSSRNPFFGFNGLTTGPHFSCKQDGPYPWNNNRWFVQRIKGLLINPAKCSESNGKPCTLTLIRACSIDAAHPESDPNVYPGPCGTIDGAGPRGCEVCFRQEIAQ